MTWTTPPSASAPPLMLFSEETLGDSDKLLDLDALGFVRPLCLLELRSVRLEFAASSAAGTRTLQLRAEDASGDVIWALPLTGFDVEADGVQNVTLFPGVTELTGVQGFAVLPGRLAMGPNWRLRLWDSTAVDVAGDDLVAHVTGVASWG